MTTPLASAVLRFAPVYKSYLWGGASLPRRLGRRDAPALDRYAESWELSDHPDGMSVAEGGPFAGIALDRLVREHGRELTGAPSPHGFPLLVKILESADRLSVQVHPDAAAARRHGGEAKTECWYILEAGPGASVWAGLRPGTDEAAFRRALENENVESLLNRVPVRRGDLLFIPGGRVHAIGEGCLILEVQQRSNTTYRVFDWNRRGPDGKPRDLHVEQAMKVIRWEDPEPPLAAPGEPARAGANTATPRLACPYFKLDELVLREPMEVRHNGASFHALHVTAGTLRIEPAGGTAGDCPRGATVLLPAAMRRYRLVPQPDAAAIRITL